MVATETGLTTHVPPTLASLRVMKLLTHTTESPVIAGGSGNTVIVKVTEHPVGSVYVMVSCPGPTPVTKPEVPIVATLVLLDVQTPPTELSDIVVVSCRHNVFFPVMTFGVGLTVTMAVAIQPVFVSV